MNVRHRSSLWRRLARRLGRELFRIAENNEETRIARNGERWLLRELLRAHVRGGGKSPCVVMDAGANIGGYSRELLELPAALEVRDYAPWMENYAYSNYVALSPRWLQAHDGQR
jgi:hypothetical protein